MAESAKDFCDKKETKAHLFQKLKNYPLYINLLCVIISGNYEIRNLKECNMLNTIVSVIYVIICIFLSAVVLLQEGKSQGLGAIGGIADTYWGKNKGRSMEGTLEKLTAFAAGAFIILAFILNLNIFN